MFSIPVVIVKSEFNTKWNYHHFSIVFYSSLPVFILIRLIFAHNSSHATQTRIDFLLQYEIIIICFRTPEMMLKNYALKVIKNKMKLNWSANHVMGQSTFYVCCTARLYTSVCINVECNRSILFLYSYSVFTKLIDIFMCC